jgi:hypothetical protein
VQRLPDTGHKDRELSCEGRADLHGGVVQHCGGCGIGDGTGPSSFGVGEGREPKEQPRNSSGRALQLPGVYSAIGVSTHASGLRRSWSWRTAVLGWSHGSSSSRGFFSMLLQVMMKRCHSDSRCCPSTVLSKSQADRFRSCRCLHDVRSWFMQCQDSSISQPILKSYHPSHIIPSIACIPSSSPSCYDSTRVIATPSALHSAPLWLPSEICSANKLSNTLPEPAALSARNQRM